MTIATKPLLCSLQMHDWDYKSSACGLSFPKQRVCRVCGMNQHIDFAIALNEGRTVWVDAPPTPKVSVERRFRRDDPPTIPFDTDY